MPEVLAANFLVPNGTFVVELIAFLLVLAALRRWVLPYVNKAMQERQATIRKSLEDAEEARRRHEQAEEEYRRAISEARAEARRLVDEANRIGEQLREDARQRGEQEYQRIVSRAMPDIEASARRASQEIRQQVGELVVAVVERVVGVGLTSDQQRALVDRTIAEVESQSAASGVST